MGLYESLKKMNVVEAIRATGYKMDLDGKVRIPLKGDTDGVWLSRTKDPQRECIKWLSVYFQYFKVIHPGCMSCWKIFYFPRTVEELFEIHEKQKEHKLGRIANCKCGIETRAYSGRLGGYAAFWYNKLGCGLDKAREVCKQLGEEYQLPLKLKRGCTEMEQFTINHLGLDSSEWDRLLEPARHKLTLLEHIFELDESKIPVQTQMVVNDIKTRWIEFAAEHGDMTYRKFVDKEFFPQLKEYSSSIDRGRDIDDGRIWRDYKKFGIGEELTCKQNGEPKIITSFE